MTERLRALFATVLRAEMPLFSPNTAFDTLPEWDSVAHLALLLEVEKEFGIAFTSAEMVAMKTVGDMIELLEMRATR